MRTQSLLSFPLVLSSLAWLPAQTVGEPAPDITWDATLQFGDAPATKLSDLRGSVVLLEFWATWCGPCKAQIPHLNELHMQKADQGLVIVGVSNEPQGTVEGFLQKTEMRYPIALAKPAEYPVRGIPHSFLIGTDGKLLWSGHPNKLDKTMLAEALVGAQPAFLPKGLEEVRALQKNGDHGAAYNKAKDLLASGALPDASRAGAKRLLASIEKFVADELAKADAAVAAKDLAAQWAALEPIARHYHGVPRADEAVKRHSALLADPANKREIAAAKLVAVAAEHEAKLDFDTAHRLYGEVAGAHAGTAAAARAGQRRRAIEIEGRLGFDAKCAECKVTGTACRTHRKKP